MISKDLLSEVLKLEIFDIKYNRFSSKLTYNKSKSNFPDYGHINIYELAYRCRLKALEWGYEIVELSYTLKVYKNSFEVYSLETETDKPYDLERFFNLCQWILENKDK